MTLPSARQMSGRAKKAHPGLGACQSEKLELEISPVALRQRLDHRHRAPIIHKSREKVTMSPDVLRDPPSRAVRANVVFGQRCTLASKK